MRIGIMGVGRVGSSIAYSLLFHPGMNNGTVVLHDIDEKKLAGEQEDLRQAAYILGKSIRIETGRRGLRGCDMIFVCIGRARKSSLTSMEVLHGMNKRILRDAVHGMPRDRTVIITNPAERFADETGAMSLDDRLDKARMLCHGKPGCWILDMKGYTNWGIASMAWRHIQCRAYKK